MKPFMKFSVLAFTALTLGFVACKKENDNNDVDTTSSIDNAVADASFNDVVNISDEAATGSLESYRTLGNERIATTCASITVDTIANPHLITIDFGTTDCLCKDGNYRRGIIYVSFVGAYRDSGSTHIITFNNYFINYNQLTGTKTVTNNGRNGSGNLSYTINVNGTLIWDAQYGGGTSTYTSSRTREWIAGELTPQWGDDVYLIDGTSSGTTRNGSAYTLNTSAGDPLRKEIGFRHFTSGTIEFTPAGKATRYIDYSYVNGARDNLAKVTINGVTFTITLR
ncbi:hypothetical protein BH11BAC2_BH11BAC2_05100 [soil metagenome]